MCIYGDWGLVADLWNDCSSCTTYTHWVEYSKYLLTNQQCTNHLVCWRVTFVVVNGFTGQFELQIGKIQENEVVEQSVKNKPVCQLTQMWQRADSFDHNPDRNNVQIDKSSKWNCCHIMKRLGGRDKGVLTVEYLTQKAYTYKKVS